MKSASKVIRAITAKGTIRANVPSGGTKTLEQPSLPYGVMEAFGRGAYRNRGVSPMSPKHPKRGK